MGQVGTGGEGGDGNWRRCHVFIRDWKKQVSVAWHSCAAQRLRERERVVDGAAAGAGTLDAVELARGLLGGALPVGE